MTHDDLIKQYFMKPDTVDTAAESKRIDDLLYHEMITDINYVPKTLEEAKQHPLWVDGHIGGIELVYKLLFKTIIGSFIFCLIYNQITTDDSFLTSLIVCSIYHIVPFLIMLFATKKSASLITAPPVIAILGSSIIILINTYLNTTMLQAPQFVIEEYIETWLPMFIYIMFSIPLAFSCFVNRRAYILNYVEKFKFKDK